jgi:hypothetical protein
MGCDDMQLSGLRKPWLVLAERCHGTGVSWWDNEAMAITAGAESADRAVGARVGAVVVALWWAVPFFGIIDLLVGIIPSKFPDEYDWTPTLVTSTSWGLLFTVLVPVPLIAWAVRPTGWVGPQVVAVGAAVLVAGLAAVAAGQIVVALLVAASAAFPRMWRPRPEWSLRRLVATPAFWPVDALVALAFGAALFQAWDVLDTAGSRAADDDNTWGLMHLPMQAGFTLAIAAAAAAGVWALGNRAASWWFAIVPPAASAVWFGVFCARHPDLLGSLGRTAGWYTAAWGVAIAVAVWATGYWTRPSGTRASGGHPLESG